MFSDIKSQITYYGTLDDVVDRYPGSKPVDLKSIQSQLITSTIYGKTILLNDGYLIANPLLVGDIENIGRSLIGALLTNGTARMFSRHEGADLASGFARTAETVRNHRQIVDDPKVWPNLQRQLDYLSAQVRHKTVIWPRDKNMGHLFYLLMKRIADMPPETRRKIVPAEYEADFDSIFRLFDGDVDKTTYDAARTHWEENCWRHFAGRDIDPNALGAIRIPQERLEKYPEYQQVCAMMSIANEVYHLAYSSGAAHSLRTSNRADNLQMGVATALITCFPDLLGTEDAPQAGLDEATMVAMNQLIISLPKDVTFTGDFNFVRLMDTDDKVRLRRHDYIAALQKFAEGKISFDDAADLRNAYLDSLARLMQPYVRIGRGIVGAKSLSDLMLNVFTDALKFTPGSSWLLALGVDHFRTRIIERLMVSQISTALGREGVIATQNAGEIPLARKYGFYMGPLTSAGVQMLVEQVDAHPSTTKPIVGGAGNGE